MLTSASDFIVRTFMLSVKTYLPESSKFCILGMSSACRCGLKYLMGRGCVPREAAGRQMLCRFSPFIKRTARCRSPRPWQGRSAGRTLRHPAEWHCRWAEVPVPRRHPARQTASDSRQRCRHPDGGKGCG